MAACAPARFLANDRNLVRDATLVPSSVEGSELVVGVPVARIGTAQVRLTGEYTGAEPADYDVEIVDTTPDVPRVSAPVFSGAGSARLVDVAAVGLDAQEIVVELVDAGKPATYAAVAFEGVTLKARTIGAGGNDLRIEIDQSGLTFTETDYSLLVDMQAGQGGPSSGVEGAGFDWDTAVLGADDVIPAGAHRIAFGDDRSAIYLQYKRYSDNRWTYHFVPELKRAIPKGAPVLFVTGGRTVTISDGGSPVETYSGVATVYDLLSQVRTSSALVSVDGVVANDRSPTGQAARELLVRTDAHVEPSTGTGSAAAAGGMSGAYANANAQTVLVVARCFAITPRDHPLARLGRERWQVTTSLAGVIGEAVTAEEFVDPDARFGFTIPRVLPPGYGIQKGRFSFVGVSYVARDAGVENPPVCPVSLTLGPDAVDQTLTLRWTKRPSGDCNCSNMPAPRLGGRCLGAFSTEGDDMGYSTEARTRLVSLYEWYADFARSNSAFVDTGSPTYTEATQDSALVAPNQNDSTFVRESVRTIVGWFEETIAAIDELAEGESPDLRGDAFAAWDVAFDEFAADLDAIETGNVLLSVPNERYRARLDLVLATGGLSPLGKTDASILESGDGCWRDVGDDYYFTVEGSVGGGYAPVFANVPYYSSRRATDEGRFYATREFAFQINVKCPDDLLEGDTVTLAIGDAGWPATYNIGDTITLPVIAAAPLYLAGGRDDDSEQTWSVTGSEYGPFAPWQFVPETSPTAYSDGGLSFDIAPGGIPNAKGDRFAFSVEGGHFRWRKDGGAWSSAADIPAGSTALDAGLFVEFVPGAAPSFEAGDVHSFRVLQPWAVSNVQDPRPSRWKWADESGPATLDVDFGAVHDLDTVALAMHTIPEGATITLDGGELAANEWSESFAWREWVAVQVLLQTRSARYLRITIDADEPGAIGWLWAGEALGSTLSADMEIRTAFALSRANLPAYQRASTLGKQRGLSVAWSEGALSEDDAAALLAMFEHVKSSDDEPIVVLPNVNRPADAIVGTIVEDSLPFPEVHGEQPNDGSRRRYSTSFEVRGIWPT